MNVCVLSADGAETPVTSSEHPSTAAGSGPTAAGASDSAQSGLGLDMALFSIGEESSVEPYLELPLKLTGIN